MGGRCCQVLSHKHPGWIRCILMTVPEGGLCAASLRRPPRAPRVLARGCPGAAGLGAALVRGGHEPFVCGSGAARAWALKREVNKSRPEGSVLSLGGRGGCPGWVAFRFVLRG